MMILNENQGNKTISKALVFFVVLWCQGIFLYGQGEVADSVSAEQIKEIQTLVNQDRKEAKLWWNGWIWGYNAATIGQAIVYFSSTNLATKQDMALGSATTILGTLSLLVTPIVPRNPDKINIGQNMRPSYYEAELIEIARREKIGRSWKSHAICSVANLGSGLITWKGFDRTFTEGLLNFALNSVITEAQIWTQPTRAIRDYQNYKLKYYQEAGHAQTKPETEWFVHVYPGRISIRIDF